MKLLVANRGESAIRIIRAAAELSIPTVAGAPHDDAASPPPATTHAPRLASVSPS